MKKAFLTPEFHVVNLNTDKTMSELAAMSDTDLERVMTEGGYFENKALYQVTDNYVVRSVAGETVLVPVGEQNKQLNGYATFTETGQFLWNVLSEHRSTLGDLVFLLSREYGKKPEDVQEDVKEFLDKAIQNGMIVRNNA